MLARERTDMLTTDVAFNLADVVVVVVSDITLQDQLFLQAAFEQLRAHPKRFRDVIVVHNFREAADIDTLSDLWQQQVARSYPGELVSEPMAFGPDRSPSDVGVWWRHRCLPGSLI
jgi:hypothetical protein